jgi:hypothetical protein
MTEENITNSSLMPSVEPSGMPSLEPTGMPTTNQTLPTESSANSGELGYIVIAVISFCICAIFTGIIAYIKYKNTFAPQDTGTDLSSFTPTADNLETAKKFVNVIAGDVSSDGGWSQ